MGFKLGLITGAAIGYVVASRIDPATRDRIQTQVTEKVGQLRDDPRVHDMVDSVKSVTADVIDAVDERAAAT
ncbi:MAG: YtxH domain-containing protein [Acidimicrobiales bacterium]